jgi:flagella basal body P-ring formation protein FlgA
MNNKINPMKNEQNILNEIKYNSPIKNTPKKKESEQMHSTNIKTLKKLLKNKNHDKKHQDSVKDSILITQKKERSRKQNCHDFQTTTINKLRLNHDNDENIYNLQKTKSIYPNVQREVLKNREYSKSFTEANNYPFFKNKMNMDLKTEAQGEFKFRLIKKLPPKTGTIGGRFIL